MGLCHGLEAVTTTGQLQLARQENLTCVKECLESCQGGHRWRHLHRERNVRKREEEQWVLGDGAESTPEAATSLGWREKEGTKAAGELKESQGGCRTDRGRNGEQKAW